MRGGGGEAAAGAEELWAKAAELERQFDGYNKRRLAGRRADRPDGDVPSGGGGAAGDAGEEDAQAAAEKGRRYEAYVRRRDEKLRQGWRARMEVKEAEMKALWARLDRGRRRDADLAAGPHREQKPGNFDAKPASPVTPRCSSAMKVKLSRPRSSISTPPSATSASPRLSNPELRRRALHQEAPPPAATPRKENRMPPPSTTPTPRLKALARSRSALKDNGFSSMTVTPRPPRFRPPRSSYDGAGDWPEHPVPAPPISTADDAIAPAAQRSLNEHQRIPDVEAKNLSFSVVDECNGADDDDTSPSSGKIGGTEMITGDSDTEPSYVYIKKDNEDDKEAGSFEEAMALTSSETNMTTKESPVADADAEGASRRSSDSLYSNVQSSFSQRSELDASAAGSPLHGSPSSSAPTTEQLLEADAAMLRKKREEEEEEEVVVVAERSVLIPSAPTSCTASAVQSPMDAVAGLKRFLNFGKKNSKGIEGDDNIGQGWPSCDSIKPRIYFSDSPSDDLDSSYLISAHVRSLQSCVPASGKSGLKEVVPPAKSPRAHRSFFSFTSFKSRGN